MNSNTAPHLSTSNCSVFCPCYHVGSCIYDEQSQPGSLSFPHGYFGSFRIDRVGDLVDGFTAVHPHLIC